MAILSEIELPAITYGMKVIDEVGGDGMYYKLVNDSNYIGVIANGVHRGIVSKIYNGKYVLIFIDNTEFPNPYDFDSLEELFEYDFGAFSFYLDKYVFESKELLKRFLCEEEGC